MKQILSFMLGACTSIGIIAYTKNKKQVDKMCDNIKTKLKKSM